MGDFHLDFGGVDGVWTSRRTVFILFLVVVELPVDLLDVLSVFSNDLFSPSFVFLFRPRLAFTQAPFCHLKHGLLQQFLESDHRPPQIHTQKPSAGWATGGVPSILDIRLFGSNWEFPRRSREMLFVCGFDASVGAKATGVVAK